MRDEAKGPAKAGRRYPGGALPTGHPGQGRPLRQVLAGVLLPAYLMLSGPVQAATTDVTVNETIVPDNCELGFTGLDGFDGLDWGTIPSESMSTAGAVSDVKTFNIVLTKCGNDYGSAVPTITVTGTPAGTTPATAKWQFRDANSKSQGVGFILRYGDSSVTWVGGAKPPNLFNGARIATTGGDVTMLSTWKTTPMPVAVALSTGDLTGQTAGTVRASVTFTFEYK